MLHRLLAFAIIALEAGLLGYLSRHWVFAAPAMAAALLGCMGLWYRRVPKRTKALTIFVGLPLVFARWDSDAGSVATLMDTATAMQGIAQFIIWAQLIDFFLIDDAEEPTDRHGGWSKPPWALPFSGVVVISALSAGVHEPTQQFIYVASSAVYVTLFIAYYGLRNAPRRNGRPHVSAGSAVLAATMSAFWLICGLGLGVESTVLVHRNLAAIDSYLNHLIFPDRGGSGMGFSRDATLGTIRAAKRTGAEKIAVRVVAAEKPGYLRACAFDTWDGVRWSSARPAGQVLQASASPPVGIAEGNGNRGSFALRGGLKEEGRSLRVWPRTEMSGAYMVPLSAAWLAAQDSSVAADDSLAVSSSSGGAQPPYDLVAARGEDEWAGASALSPELRERCTSVPEAVHPGVRALAGEVTRACSTSLERIRAVERHLRRREYNFGIVIPDGRNPLEYFLLEKAPAHCEYYASGAAILLRLSGVPCRYVTGFVAAERNALGGHWLARNRDAHAWVEAWDDGDPVSGRGARWITVEATPPGGVPGGETSSIFDSLWDQATFLVARIRYLFRASGIMALPQLLGWALRSVFLTAPGQTGLLFVVAVFLLARLRRRLRRVQQPLPEDLKALHGLRHRMDRYVRGWGLARRPGETLNGFADRLVAEPAAGPNVKDIADWYRSYAAVRYRPVRDPVQIACLAETTRRLVSRSPAG